MIRSPIAILFLLLVAAPAWADDLKTLAGKTLNGTLDKISDSEIVLKTATGPVSTPLAQVLELTLRVSKTIPAPANYSEVVLADESVLRCTKITFGANARLSLTSGGSVVVPISALVTILRDAQDGELKKQWTKLLKTKARGDRIFILRGGDLNPVEGSLGDIDPAKQTIKFKRDGAAEIEPALDKIQGLQFSRTDVLSEPSLCKIVDLDGSVLVASKLDYSGKHLSITTPFGQKVALEPTTLASIDFNFGRLTYLSDLDAKMPESFLLGGFNPVRKDLNLNGDAIMLQEKEYPKGLSMYAGAELNYDLAGKYREFKAILGAVARIAEEGQGKVTVSVYCDGEKRFSDLVSTKALKNIAINVKDVTTLRIVVSGSNFTNFSGHATLANAHVSQ